MFRVTKNKSSKSGYFLLLIDSVPVLQPSTALSVGVVGDRASLYAEELKTTLFKPENFDLLRYIFHTAHKKGTLVIETRMGDWVLSGFMQFVRVHQQACYMAFDLPLTDEEKQVSSLLYE